MQSIGKKLREARKDQDLSLRELAAKAEVSASMLSQIENNRANPSVRTLYNLAAALALPVDYFFTDEPAVTGTEAGEHVEMTASEMRNTRAEGASVEATTDFVTETEGPILNKAERPSIELMGGVTWSRLTPKAEDGFEILEIRYEPGAASGSARSHHSGREFGTVLEGELSLELGFEEYLMGPGDSTIFNSKTPHRLSNNGKEPVLAIWVVIDSE